MSSSLFGDSAGFRGGGEGRGELTTDFADFTEGECDFGGRGMVFGP